MERTNILKLSAAPSCCIIRYPLTLMRDASEIKVERFGFDFPQTTVTLCCKYQPLIR